MAESDDDQAPVTAIEVQRGQAGRFDDKPDCPARIDELAKPKRWLLLHTWKYFGYILEPERTQMLKEKVQEQFSMSPEETELYFSSLRRDNLRRVDYKTIRKRFREEKRKARKEAYNLFRTILKRAMKYAFKHAPPLLVSPMLRIVADHILEILAELHKVEVPKRTNNDRLAQFLIAVADWTSIFIANIYYEIELETRTDMEKIHLTKSVTESIEKVPSEEITVQATDYTDFDEIEDGEDMPPYEI